MYLYVISAWRRIHLLYLISRPSSGFWSGSWFDPLKDSKDSGLFQHAFPVSEHQTLNDLPSEPGSSLSKNVKWPKEEKKKEIKQKKSTKKRKSSSKILSEPKTGDPEWGMTQRTGAVWRLKQGWPWVHKPPKFVWIGGYWFGEIVSMLVAVTGLGLAF